MSVPQWAWELARDFWREAGPAPPFPRRIRAVLEQSSFCLPVESLPGLSTRSVEQFLKKRGISWAATRHYRLHGALVAQGDVGWIFLDSDDPDDEQGFSLAHELAHYLRHVWQPRRRAAALGAGPAFDGMRHTTSSERVAALLRGVALEPYSHLRQRDGDVCTSEIDRTEREADLLALELLAPEEALGELNDIDAIRKRFGIPEYVARRLLSLDNETIPTPVSDRLKKVLGVCRPLEAGGEQKSGGE
jgi:hypothetical protein